MPSPIVKVTFNGTAWTFDPQRTPVSGAGPIIVKRDPPSASWTLESVNGLPASYTTNRQGDGMQISINDPFDGQFGVLQRFSVTVLFNGTSYTSPMQSPVQVPGGPPPIIVNDVTTPG